MSSDDRILCDACGAGCPKEAKECVRCGKPLTPPPEKIQPITGKVIGVLLFLTIGIVGESAVFVMMSRGKASANWPTVEGTVLSAGLGRETYQIEYAYSVNGTDYIGRRITYMQDSTVHYSYKKGQTVTVHYDPGNPKIAVLRTAYRTGGFVIVAIAIFVVFFLIPFWQISVILKTRARNHELIRTGRLTR